MQETRSALTEKLEALEQKVTGTVDTTASAVAETVQNLTDTVQETVGTVKESVASTVDTVEKTVENTVETVKDTLDIPGHIQPHPWLAMFGSVATGYLVGRMLHAGETSSSRGGTDSSNWMGWGVSWPEAMKQSSTAPPPEQQQQQQQQRLRAEEDGRHQQEERKPGVHEGIAGSFLNALGGEADKLKSLGVAALFGVVRDLVTQSVPGELGSRLKEWVNDLTQKMGAKPITEPVLDTGQHEGQQQQEDQKKAGEEAPSSSQQQKHVAKGAPSQPASSRGSAPRR